MGRHLLLAKFAVMGDPARPLLWVSKSLDKLASALVAMGHSISPNSVQPPRSQCAV